MLWIGLHLPRLGIEVFERTLATNVTGSWQTECGHQLVDGTCLAVCDRVQILHANAAASARGVGPAQRSATAQALCPDLLLRSRDLMTERATLEQIACWASQFTPRISLRWPHERDGQAGLLLDVADSLKLFGGLDQLLTRLRLGLQDLGFKPAIGCATTAKASWLLARFRDGLIARSEYDLDILLGDVPVALLETLIGARADNLQAIGARLFRDLVRLPRNGLARRFGEALLHEIDQALGLQPEVLPWYEAPRRFEATLELVADVDDAESLVFAARRLLLQLSGWLMRRHAAVRRVVIEAHHDRRRRRDTPLITPIELRFALPSWQTDPMVAVLRERLVSVKLPAAVHTLVLRCDEVIDSSPHHASLLPDPVSTEETLGRLVERLQARLGHDQVRRLVLAADHRPENAYRAIPVDGLPPQPGRSAKPRSLAPITDGLAAGATDSLAASATVSTVTPRPLWLLEQPQPLTERQQRPWWHGPLRLLAGPERIEGGWWDGHLVERDYFIAENDQSQWLWIFRTRGRGHNPHRPAAPRWFLQGIFG